MAADYAPGDYVAYAHVGACRVVGVGDVTAEGETFAALSLAPLVYPGAIVRVPVAKLTGARLRVVSATDAEAMAERWEPPRPKWGPTPFDVQRARRIASRRALNTA
ncbi:MAG: CarD family transcriptional regulator [Caulobacterales bacterium]|nr:CarD family transcriptional regulator [Caulobacterales bacterium]